MKVRRAPNSDFVNRSRIESLGRELSAQWLTTAKTLDDATQNTTSSRQDGLNIMEDGPIMTDMSKNDIDLMLKMAAAPQDYPPASQYTALFYWVSDRAQSDYSPNLCAEKSFNLALSLSKLSLHSKEQRMLVGLLTRTIHLQLRTMIGTRANLALVASGNQSMNSMKGSTIENDGSELDGASWTRPISTTAEQVRSLHRATVLSCRLEEWLNNETNNKKVNAYARYMARRAIMNLWSKRCRFLIWRLKTHDVSNPSLAMNNMIDALLPETDLSREELVRSFGQVITARDCLVEMEALIDRAESEDDKVCADSSFYSQWLGAASKLPNGVEDSLAILDRFERKCRDILPEDIGAYYSGVLIAFFNEASAAMSRRFINGPTTVTQEGKEIIDRAFHWWDNRNNKDLNAAEDIAFSILMNLRRLADQPEEAEELLTHMISVGRQPSIVHYNICLNAWAIAAERDPSARARAESLLQKIKQPDAISYTAVIKACLNSGRGGMERAKALLDLLEEKHATEKNSSALDLRFYREFRLGIIDAMSKVFDSQERCEMAKFHEALLGKMPKIETQDFNASLLAWTRTVKARSEVRRLFEMVEEKVVEPDSNTYRLLLKGLISKTPTQNDLELAKAIMADIRVRGMTLHIGVVNQYVRLLARGKRPSEAEELVRTMEEDFSSGRSHVAPQETTYRYILEEHWKRRPIDINGASAWFQHMKDLSAHRPDLKPGEGSYAVRLETWTDFATCVVGRLTYACFRNRP